MSKRILIVDDDNTVREYLSTVLAENGYKTICAEDGKEGLFKAIEHKPDLIVLDVMMPNKSGIGTFKALKKDSRVKDIPVIMLTSIQQVIDDGKNTTSDNLTFEELKGPLLGKMEKLVEYFRDGGVARPERFVDKPIEPDEFLAVVESVFLDAA